MTGIGKNTLLRNLASLGAVQAASSLIQLLVIPHVVRKVGVDGFGIVATAQVIMLLITAITDYGFNQTATRHIALKRDNPALVSVIFYRVLFSKLLLLGAAFIFLVILVLAMPFLRFHFMVYLLGFMFVIGQTCFINWFFQGIERMQYLAILTLVGRIIFAFLVFLFIRQRGQESLFLFFLGAGNFIAAIVGIFLAHRVFKVSFKRPSVSEVSSELKEGWSLMIANLSGFVCQYANLFLLRVFTNDLVVGYFGIAERIFLTVKQILVVFSQAIYPQVCRAIRDGRNAVTSYFRKIYAPFFACFVSLVLLLYFFAPRVLAYFIPSRFQPSVFYLRAFCLVLAIVCLNIPATVSLLGLDQRKKYLMVVSTALVLNLSCNLILVAFFGPKGTVSAILITETFITAALNLQFFRMMRSGVMVNSVPG